MKLAMSAAHGGFGSEIVPLGGGAAVFERLVQSVGFAPSQLQLIGAGPRGPERADYYRVGAIDRAPSELGVLEYARFCRHFEDATTEAVLRMKPDILLAHDISEGPNIARVRAAGIKIATIFHVDVVDIFSRLYLAGMAPSALTKLYRATRRLPWPAVLKLVFEKQQAVMEAGSLSIVPSKASTELLSKCYPESRVPLLTLGWGAPSLTFHPPEIESKVRTLRASHGIPAEHKIVLTLSRLSPEKAQHRLLLAVKQAESDGSLPPMTIVLAGAPAFMEGRRHEARLKRIAATLKTPVVFPGHVGGLEKAAWYRAASVFVVNSLHESYGLTTLEAMQQGCPVVAVRSSGTLDTVSPEAGCLVPPGPELTRRLWGSIRLLLSEEDVRRRMAGSARAWAHEHTFERASQRLYQRLVELHEGR